jgi:hypothetical protein
MAVGLSLAVAIGGCAGKTVVQSASGTGSGGFGGGMVVDPPPPDGGLGGMGTGGHGGFGGGMVVDPPPPDDAGLGALEIESDDRAASLGVPTETTGPRRLRHIDQWFDTSPKATARTVDLPLFDPPRPRLAARRDGEDVVVTVEGTRARVSVRWEAEGEIVGSGSEVRWRPSGPADRVRVAVRARGGVAVLSLRADDAIRS